MTGYVLERGDCLEVLRTMGSDSVDAIVTDPPYGLAFMGKRWDYDVPSVDIWAECLRVLKPGGHLLAFAGTRTQHRMAVRIEDAGFEIRDMIAWVYGSGFPKSLNVATAIEKMAEPTAEPTAEEVEFCQWLRHNSTVEAVTATLGRRFWDCEIQIVNAATKERPVMARRALVPTAAKWQGFKAQHRDAIPPRIEELVKPEPQRAETPGDEWTPGKGSGTAGAGDWSGWGTALKPAMEPITVARKPLVGTVAENVLRHGTGAINVDGCRVVALDQDALTASRLSFAGKTDNGSFNACKTVIPNMTPGRWPANLIHDGSEEVVGLFPHAIGGHYPHGGKRSKKTDNAFGTFRGNNQLARAMGDNGTAARFFYCAKASKADRGTDNQHPTVKPTDLMRYLCRLVTPPGGIVLDPFMGSGSTGKAALLEGFQFIGIEREQQYLDIARARIKAAADEAAKPRQKVLGEAP